MPTTRKIPPCLWFDDQAEEAAKFYTGIFKNSRITSTTRYSTAGQETHHKPPGSVMTVEFDLDGETFTALNGGPEFKFNEALSLQVRCADQKAIDYFWTSSALAATRRHRSAAGSRIAMVYPGRSSRSTWKSSIRTKSHQAPRPPWKQ